MASAPGSNPGSCGRRRKKSQATTPARRSRPLYPDRADTIVVLPRRGRCAASVRKPGSSGPSPSRASRRSGGRLKYRCPAASLLVHLCRSRAPLLPGSGHAGGRLRPISCGLPLPTRTGGSSVVTPHSSPSWKRPAIAYALVRIQPSGQRLRVRTALPAGPEPGEGTGRVALTVMMAGLARWARPGRDCQQRMRSLVGAVPFGGRYRIASTPVHPAIATKETETVGVEPKGLLTPKCVKLAPGSRCLPR